MTRLLSRWPLALLLVGLVLVCSGLALTRRAPRADAPDLGRPVAAAASSASAPPPVPAAPSAAPVVAPSAPQSLGLPGIAQPVPLVPIGASRSGALALPDVPSVLGWYAAGALPGDATGTAVIAGHVDSAQYGAGPLRRLLDLRLGDRIEVTDDVGAVHLYSVTSRTTYRKADLPRTLFTTQGPPQLAMVTCGGAFDRSTGSYEDNVVVLASAVPPGAPATQAR